MVLAPSPNHAACSNSNKVDVAISIPNVQSKTVKFQVHNGDTPLDEFEMPFDEFEMPFDEFEMPFNACEVPTHECEYQSTSVR
jgi:hypothetical protein